MTKFVIPSILAVTILIGGVFAFMPVEQASTVHTTIQASTTDVIVDSGNTKTIADGVATSTQTITLTFTGDAVVTSIKVSIPAEGADDYDISGVTSRGVALLESTAIVDPGPGTAISVDLMNNFGQLAVASGDTIVITVLEEDTTDGADATATVDVVMLANSGASVAAT